MKIDGKLIASHLFEEIKTKVEQLKQKEISPHLVVVLVGNDPASAAYVRQKELKTLEVGAYYTGYKLPESTSKEELLTLIKQLNENKNVHGIIVQLPLPKHLDSDMVLEVKPEKDIDAFNPQSPYPMPLAKAVLKILENVYKTESDHLGGGRPSLRGHDSREVNVPSFISWMEMQKIVVIGKGKTGGGPTIDMFRKLGLKPQIIDSKTTNPKEITKDADIIVSTVGRQNIITPDMIKQGVIIISVGMHRGEDGKLHGDYNPEEIKDIASYYTPVPGGVGPVNVACLIENLILATESQT